MRGTIVPISNFIIEAGILLAVFLLPLVFFPFAADLAVFEFSKQMVLYVLVAAIFFFWTLRMVLVEKVEIQRTVADPLILVFLSVYVLTAVFSLHRWTSVFGAYPSLHGGLVSMTAYALLYFAIISHVKEQTQFLRVCLALAFSGILLSTAGIFHLFRLSIGPVDFSDGVWVLIGSTEKAGMWISMVFPVLFGLFFYHKGVIRKTFFFVAGIFVLGYLAFLNYYPALVFIVGGGGIVFLGASKRRTAVAHMPYLIVLVAMVGSIVLARNISFLNDRIPHVKDPRASREISVGHQVSWMTILREFNFPKNVFLGSGPATYAYDYARFRPQEVNATEFWNIKFARASNEVFQMLSTIGILGLAAFLAPFLYSLKRVIPRFPKKTEEGSTVFLGLVVGIVTGLLFSLFTATASSTMFLFWALLALLFCAMAIWKKSDLVRPIRISLASFSVIEGLVSDKDKRQETLAWMVFLGTTLLLIVFFFFGGKYFLADLSYARSLRASTVGEAVRDSGRAVGLFPQNETYRMNAARIAVSSAVNFAAQRQELTQNEESDLVALLAVGRDEAISATTLTPFNAFAWEERGNTFLTLATRFNVKGAEDEALAAYTQASRLSTGVALDPINPRYPVLRGLIYERFKNDLDLAEQQYLLALNLKADYAAAVYRLAQVYRERGRIGEAQALLDQLVARYDALDFAQTSDLGLSKEQLVRERDGLALPKQNENE